MLRLIPLHSSLVHRRNSLRASSLLDSNRHYKRNPAEAVEEDVESEKHNICTMYHSRRIGRPTLLRPSHAHSSNRTTVSHRYLIRIHANEIYNSCPVDHGCKPADTSNAPCHPRSLRPLSQRTTLTACARASMPHSTKRNPLSQEVSASQSSNRQEADIRVEPMEVVPLPDVIHNPIRRDAFSHSAFPQDPLIVFVYGVGTESGHDDEDSRLRRRMSFDCRKSVEALTAPWVVASEISSARCKSFNLRIMTRRLQAI